MTLNVHKQPLRQLIWNKSVYVHMKWMIRTEVHSKYPNKYARKYSDKYPHTNCSIIPVNCSHP